MRDVTVMPALFIFLCSHPVVTRRAGSQGPISLGTNHRGERFLFSNKLECCRDRTEEDQTQWLTVNNFRYLYNHALTWVGKLNLSWPDNQQTRIDDGRFTETDIGLAYLPVSNDCLSMLGKYTYLYDLNSAVPADPTTDARSHMVSVEGIYDFIWRWELGAKLAWNRGEMRAEHDAGDWYLTVNQLAVARGCYHMTRVGMTCSNTAGWM
jgi:hypothetical protein